MAVQKKFALGRGLDALISTEEVSRLIFYQRDRTEQNIRQP